MPVMFAPAFFLVPAISAAIMAIRAAMREDEASENWSDSMRRDAASGETVYRQPAPKAQHALPKDGVKPQNFVNEIASVSKAGFQVLADTIILERPEVRPSPQPVDKRTGKRIIEGKADVAYRPSVARGGPTIEIETADFIVIARLDGEKCYDLSDELAHAAMLESKLRP